MSRGSRVRSPPGVYGACSVMVIIEPSQGSDPGSIPGRRSSAFWGISSIGRVRALQARGTGIETPMLQINFFTFGRCSLRQRSGRFAPEFACLDGRAVQGARLKFESLRRRGFESHSKQRTSSSFYFFLFVHEPARVHRFGRNPAVGHWSSGMILL